MTHSPRLLWNLLGMAVIVYVLMTIGGRWLQVKVSAVPAAQPQASLAPASPLKSAGRARPVVIDPLTDPLAPRDALRRPDKKEVSRPAAAASRPAARYESPTESFIMAQ